MTENANPLEDRLATLEQQHRRLKAGFGLVAIIAFAPLAMGARQAGGDVLRAQRFEVVNNGRVVAVLDSTTEGGRLLVNRATGSRAGFFQATANGGSLDISNAGGKTVGFYDSSASDGAVLCIGNANSLCVAQLSTLGGSGRLDIAAPNSKSGIDSPVQLQVDLTGSGVVRVRDADGKALARLPN